MEKYSLIVLANTVNDSIFEMNNECLNSFVNSADGIVSYDIILIEGNKKRIWNYIFKNLTIIYPEEEFNFHKFLNIGISIAKGNNYILSNNDVIYDKYWLKNLLDIRIKNKQYLSFSPLDPHSNRLKKSLIEQNDLIAGYEIQKHIAGWCLVLDKMVLKKIIKLDEKFDFYYADNDYSMMLRKFNIKHVLVTGSIAYHLGNKKTKREGNFKEIKNRSTKKKIPKYVIDNKMNWIYDDDKMIDGLIKFHEKWGGRKTIKAKLYMAEFFSSHGLGFLNRFILIHN